LVAHPRRRRKQVVKVVPARTEQDLGLDSVKRNPIPRTAKRPAEGICRQAELAFKVIGTR
jgi:hypothetical protein